MLKVENIDVYGWEAAIRGARNPMNSWNKMDTYYNNGEMEIGPNDYKLLKNLCKAGKDHRKWMRMVTVTMDITGPLYWWKEYDTYKISTVANSCSTMHKIQSKKFTLSDFSHEHLLFSATTQLTNTIKLLNEAREIYNNYDYFKSELDEAYGKDEVTKKDVWWQMIQLLPSSYNQKRTVHLNYETLNSIYQARKNHKLDEWHTLCNKLEKLPYSEFITMKFEGDTNE